MVEFSSIFRQPKWITSIHISGFSSRKEKQNVELIKKIEESINEYNKGDMDES